MRKSMNRLNEEQTKLIKKLKKEGFDGIELICYIKPSNSYEIGVYKLADDGMPNDETKIIIDQYDSRFELLKSLFKIEKTALLSFKYLLFEHYLADMFREEPSNDYWEAFNDGLLEALDIYEREMIDNDL